MWESRPCSRRFVPGVRRPFHLSVFLTAPRMALPQDPSTNRACPKSQRQEAAQLFPSDWWNQINYVLGFEERAQFATPEVQAFAAFVLLYPRLYHRDSREPPSPARTRPEYGLRVFDNPWARRRLRRKTVRMRSTHTRKRS